MSLRAKMVVESVKMDEHGRALVRLDCRYDDWSPEDQRFYHVMPDSHCEVLVSDPVAIERFKKWHEWYLDFTPAPERNDE